MSYRQHHDCEGKVRFVSLKLARAAASRRGGREAYKCDVCRGYHVGHVVRHVRKFKRPAPRRLT